MKNGPWQDPKRDPDTENQAKWCGNSNSAYPKTVGHVFGRFRPIRVLLTPTSGLQIKILAVERSYFDLTGRNRYGIDFWTIGDLISQKKSTSGHTACKSQKLSPCGRLLTRAIKILVVDRSYFDLTGRNRCGIDFWTIGDPISQKKSTSGHFDPSGYFLPPPVAHRRCLSDAGLPRSISRKILSAN